MNDRADDLPGEVSSRATIKEIKNNCCYYWQRRAGNKFRSQCKGQLSLTAKADHEHPALAPVFRAMVVTCRHCGTRHHL